MSKVIRVDAGCMAVEGDMQVVNAVSLRTQGEALIEELTSPVTVDLQGATNVGSVGVSVVLCWMRKAAQLGKQLKVVNMPDKMRDVSRVSGLEQFLDSR